MTCFFPVAALVALFLVSDAGFTRSPPKVQVYSHDPGEFDTSNVLICKVSDFHPPDITIRLLKNSDELLDAAQTDLAFTDSWHFHLTRSATFKPQRGDKFLCRVEHGLGKIDFEWEPNM